MENFEGYTREKWEDLGLLETIPEDRKDKAVHALNLSCKWTSDKTINPDEIYETLPISIILLIIKKIDLSDEEVLNICKEVRPAVEAYDFGKFNGISSLGLECEFMHEFTEYQINKLQK
jgi:hypothetical protein